MEHIVALVLATVVLVAIPGPNVAIIVAKSIHQGFRAGITATLGTTTGVAAQLLLTVFGVAAIVEATGSALAAIKWFGVVYLVWLGIRTWKARDPEVSVENPLSSGTNFSHGFMVAVLNPKILFFNAAFLPQFVSAAGSAGHQMLILSCVYLSVLLAGDALWALFAASARSLLGNYGRFSRRLTGGFLVGAGIGLALSRRTF
jgi:threonine/homoserine/homoserine lactone efflux protein